MNIDQVKAALAVIFFLAAVITAMWGTEIAGALAGAWARGKGQAAAEQRRFAAARERNNGSRGLPGAVRGARAAARAMHGAAKGAGAWARKENGPLRRIAAAAASGAVLGAKGARRAAAGARRAAAARRAAGGSRFTRGTKRHSRFRAGRPIGVCDSCGRPAGAASLKPVVIPSPGGGALKKLLCYLCRNPHQASSVDAATVLGGARPAAGALPAGRPAASPTGHAAVVPVGMGPTAAVIAPDPSALDTGSLRSTPTSSATAAVASTGQAGAGLMPGASSEALAVTYAVQPALTGGSTLMGTSYSRPAAIGGSSQAGNGLAVRPAGQVARGDSITHGEQNRVAQAVAAGIDMVAEAATRMADSLRAEDAGTRQIQDVANWAADISTVLHKIQADLAADNRRLGPYVDAVLTAGGPSEVGSRGYHSDY